MPIKVGGLYLLIRTDFHRLNEYIYIKLEEVVIYTID